MSSFFTLPASQRKRKRSQVPEKSAGKAAAPSKKREERDESISGSEGSNDEAGGDRNGGFFEDSDDEDEQYQNEDPTAKRIRLAEQYLLNTQREVLDDAGFDAADVDKENLARRMGDRLKEDTAEGKGKLYRWIADDLDWGRAEQRTASTDGDSMTSVAMQGQHIYTVDKDMAISKWEIPNHQVPTVNGKQVGRQRSKPKRVKYTRGNRKGKNDRDFLHHSNAILCIAASDDGKFVATGGVDKRLVVWDAVTLKPLKAFTQHRDAITSLAFRRGTNQLFSASRDRTVKIWSLDELAYVETLFGHQDEVVDVSALAQEKCVTVGARDRTARHWKVVEESQLVFRGGGAPGKSKHDRSSNPTLQTTTTGPAEQKPYNEGSMDRVACLDDDTFVTGSDNGSLSLWSIHKKKAVFTYPLAHGLEPPLPADILSAEENPDQSKVQGEPQPRWITALRTIPYSNVLVTGSWEGVVRAWRITEDKRRIEALGPLATWHGEQDLSTGMNTPTTAESPSAQLSQEMQQAVLLEHQLQSQPPSVGTKKPIIGVITDLAIVDRGERAKEGVLVAAAVGKEHRLGRWNRIHEGKNALVLFEVPRKVSAPTPEVSGVDGVDGVDDGAVVNGTAAVPAEKEEFVGFD